MSIHLYSAIALQVLVPCLTANPKVDAQLSYREAARLSQRYKTFFFSHRCSFFPWHNRHFSVTDVLVLTVTYVFVSYRANLEPE